MVYGHYFGQDRGHMSQHNSAKTIAVIALSKEWIFHPSFTEQLTKRQRQVSKLGSIRRPIRSVTFKVRSTR